MKPYILAVLLLATSTQPGCAIFTVAPTPVSAKVASFDGNSQNSGLISINKQGAVVTPDFIERYKSLISKFGKYFDNPIKLDPLKGVDPAQADGNYHVTLEVVANFVTMNRWKRDADAKADVKPDGLVEKLKSVL